MAAHHFALVDADPEADQAQKDANMIILSAADGDWETAVERARYLLEKEPENVVVCISLKFIHWILLLIETYRQSIIVLSRY